MLNIKNGKVKCVGYNNGERRFTVGKVYDVIDNTITNDNGYKYECCRHCEESIVDWLSCWYKFEAVGDEIIVITHDNKTTTATLYRGNEKVVATARCAPEDEFDFIIGAELVMKRLVEKTKEVVVGGFKVGDRVNVDGRNGTVICISVMDFIGVEFDKPNWNAVHSCGGVDLKAGKPGTTVNCKWFNANVDKIQHGEVPECYNGKVVCIKAGTDHWTVGKVYNVKDGIVVSDTGIAHPRYGNPYSDEADIRHIGCDILNDSRHNLDNEFVPLIEG